MRHAASPLIPLMKSKTANTMPFKLTKARDTLRRIYDAHFEDPARK